MDPTQELIDQLQQEDVEDARRLSVAQKLVLGGDLFDAACEVTLSGIVSQHPGITSTDAIEVLRQRLEFARRTETRL